jgi:preprotein translocase subunit YajC
MKKWLLPLFLVQIPALFADEVLPPPPERSFWQTFVMLGLAGLLFYFILLRPESKRRKVAEEQRSKVKKGDRVNAMGITGTVVKIQDQTIILRMYDGAKIEVVKGAISDVTPGTEEDIKKVEQDK